MQSITSILLTIAGVAILGFLGFVTLSLFMVFAGILSMTLMTRALMRQQKPAPVHARARPEKQVSRIWNDGKGTIIDM